MLGSGPARKLLARLLRRLGPPPPSPRRHFSKYWGHRGGGDGGFAASQPVLQS